MKVPCPACQHPLPAPVPTGLSRPRLLCPRCGHSFEFDTDDGLDLFQSPDELFPAQPDAPLYLPDLDALPGAADSHKDTRALFSTMDELQLGAPAPPLGGPPSPPTGRRGAAPTPAPTPTPPRRTAPPTGAALPDLEALATPANASELARSHAGLTRPTSRTPRDHQRVGRLIWGLLALLVLGGVAYVGYVAWVHDGDVSVDVLRKEVSTHVDKGVEEASNLGEAVTELADDVDPGKLDLGGGGDYYDQRVEVRNGKRVIVMVPRQSAIDQDAKGRGGLVVGPDGQARPADDAAGNAPALSTSQAGGGRFDLAEHRGETIVLNMYAVWCGPCRQEIPDLSKLNAWAASQSPPVRVYGVVFQSGSLTEAATSSRKLGVDYPILDGTPTVSAAWGVTSFPTTVIIDRDGNVAQRIQRPAHFAQLKQAVEKARAR